MTERTPEQEAVAPLLEDLDAGAVLVVAIRDPKDAAEGAHPMTVLTTSGEDADPASKALANTLARYVASFLLKHFEAAGATVDTVDRTGP